MKVKEIRLENIRILKDNSEIYSGESENLPQNLLNEDVKSIQFEGQTLLIEI